MKNLFLFLFIAMLSQGAIAQIGLSGTYSTISTSSWDDVMDGENIDSFNDGITLGLDYWFRLKDFRVEFLPEVSYSRHDNIIDGSLLVPQNLVSEMDIFSVAFNTQVYIFDIEGDCNCPTWGKEGGIFQKGFYLMAGPGVSFVSQNNIINAEQGQASEILDEQNVRLMLSAGLGLDIGITKAFTITPFGRFRWMSSSTWEAAERLATLNQNEDQFQDFDSSITQLQAGIRLSYRWGE